MNFSKLALIASLSAISMVSGFVFNGCSTAKVRVMPGEGGNNKVVATDIEKDDAEKAATEGAEDYCKERKKHAVFSGENTKYTGSMDENTRNTVRTASRVASMVGFQNRGNQPADFGRPSAVENVGNAGQGMTSDRDYKSEMSFHCE